MSGSDQNGARPPNVPLFHVIFKPTCLLFGFIYFSDWVEFERRIVLIISICYFLWFASIFPQTTSFINTLWDSKYLRPVTADLRGNGRWPVTADLRVKGLRVGGPLCRSSRYVYTCIMWMISFGTQKCTAIHLPSVLKPAILVSHLWPEISFQATYVDSCFHLVTIYCSCILHLMWLSQMYQWKQTLIQWPVSDSFNIHLSQ